MSDGVHEPLLGERFPKKGVGAGFLGARLDGQDAEDEHDDVPELGIVLDPAAEGQAVELGNEDFGDDDVGLELARALQPGFTVGRELDAEPRLVQEERLQLADVGIALDDEDDGAAPGL